MVKEKSLDTSKKATIKDQQDCCPQKKGHCTDVQYVGWVGVLYWSAFSWIFYTSFQGVVDWKSILTKIKKIYNTAKWYFMIYPGKGISSKISGLWGNTRWGGDRFRCLVDELFIRWFVYPIKSTNNQRLNPKTIYFPSLFQPKSSQQSTRHRLFIYFTPLFNYPELL